MIFSCIAVCYFILPVECLNMCGIYLSHLDMNFSKYWNLNWLTPNCPELLPQSWSWTSLSNPQPRLWLQSAAKHELTQIWWSLQTSDSTGGQFYQLYIQWTRRSAHLSYTRKPWCKWLNNWKNFCLRCLKWALNLLGRNYYLTDSWICST